MIDIRSLSDSVGAEVTGFDADDLRDGDAVAELRAAFDERGLLVFPDLEISHSQQVFLGQALIGRTSESDLAAGAPAGDNWYISNEREHATAPHGRLQFHSDGMCDEVPFQVLSLYGIEVAQPAAPTSFVSAVHAWRTLPIEMQTTIRDLRAFHTSAGIRRRDVTDVLVMDVDRPRTTIKPLAWTHPRTGETVLLACEQMTQEIVGVDQDDSERLLDELFDHMYDPAVRFVHEWRERDLVVWDNIAVQHARANVVVGGPPRTLRKTGYPTPPIASDQLPIYGGEK